MFRNRTFLRVESLDGRILPSVSTSLLNGTLTINGTNVADRIQVVSKGVDTTRVVVLSAGKAIRECAASQVRTVVFNGNAGDDYFSNALNIHTEAKGGSGKDFLSIRGRDNRIDGGADDDNLSTNGPGHHVVYGGDGNDYITGGDGNDTIYGGNGSDRLEGLKGRDLLVGDANNDILYGGDDGDTLRGGAGNDHLYGGQGKDTLFGDAGADYLNGCELNFRDNEIDILYGSDGSGRPETEKDTSVSFYAYGFQGRDPKTRLLDPECPRDFLERWDVMLNPPR